MYVMILRYVEHDIYCPTNLELLPQANIFNIVTEPQNEELCVLVK